MSGHLWVCEKCGAELWHQSLRHLTTLIHRHTTKCKEKK